MNLIAPGRDSAWSKPRWRSDVTKASTSSVPQTRCKGSPGIPVYKLNRKPFKRVSIWHSSSYRLLKLLVTRGDAGRVFQLVGGQCRRQDVAQFIVPHCGQAQVLRENSASEPRYFELLFVPLGFVPLFLSHFTAFISNSDNSNTPGFRSNFCFPWT